MDSTPVTVGYLLQLLGDDENSLFPFYSAEVNSIPKAKHAIAHILKQLWQLVIYKLYMCLPYFSVQKCENN